MSILDLTSEEFGLIEVVDERIQGNNASKKPRDCSALKTFELLREKKELEAELNDEYE